jgi:hypothetical protein
VCPASSRENELRSRKNLVGLVRASVARAYTVSAAHGEGPRNQRAGDISGGNIRIEPVLSEAFLDEVLAKSQPTIYPTMP